MHGKKRVRERVGNFSEAFLEKVKEHGQGPGNWSGSFRRYLDKLSMLKKNAKLLVYGEFIYIFAVNNGQLITALNVPSKYRKVLS